MPFLVGIFWRIWKDVLAAQQGFTTLTTAIPLLLRTTNTYLLAIPPVLLLLYDKDHRLNSKKGFSYKIKKGWFWSLASLL